ncbi:helix-turn-helix domain-containing protein [Modestobacter roseus]|uniref:AraC-like DNA-binding protein n=1 Tax=Modestobacter roseus TaxID=1181884 RepID=A0A562ISA8_9ACTN|nr:helix-turn-helix domain-containing protein [Modestobacter roseus]MQA36016.1 helix-turn-helix domain-containing protein [Modestobacter roseus]TWH73603.1 AraC-like DNA-binding protein [Modestobacter roseus]
MLLLDTATVAPAARVGAFRDAFGQASVPCRIDQLEPAERMHSRMHLWQFGTASLFTTDASGFRLTRTARHVRQEAPSVVALAVQVSGMGRFSQFDADQLVRARELMLSDLTAPYQFSWAGDGGSRAFHVSYDRLALPTDVIRAAGPRLRASPLHDLVRDHLEGLTAHADRLGSDPAAASLGTATVELVRALLVSAAGDVRQRHVWEDTLLTRVGAYIARHLTDPALTPSSIAAAHAVSVRRLYQVFADAGLSLEQEVIGRRLEAARAALVSPAGRRRSIAATARAHGFTDPSHFARRFREAYGLPPSEWQRSGHSHPTPSPSRSNVVSQPGSPARIGSAPAARTASQFL